MLAESSLETDVERAAKELGADVFGIADLTIAQDFVCKQGGEYLGEFSRAISIGIHLLDAVVDELHRREDPAVAYTYAALYNSVNSRLNHVGLLLAKRIQKKGYKAYVIPASQTVDSNKLIGVFSHKLAANLAGLGWIGKSCLLITPSHGPRVRFATILTDAPLKASSPIGEKCNDCKKCMDICPVKAFTGASFNPSDPREARFNAHLCKSYRKKREGKLGEGFLCGLCVYVCPYGRALVGESTDACESRLLSLPSPVNQVTCDAADNRYHTDHNENELKHRRPRRRRTESIDRAIP